MNDSASQLNITSADAAIDSAANWIVEKHMEVPAVMFLEMNKPLSFLISQSLYFGAPMLAPLFGLDKLNKTAGLLSDRDSIENLIRKIEQLSQERNIPEKQIQEDQK